MTTVEDTTAVTAEEVAGATEPHNEEVTEHEEESPEGGESEGEEAESDGDDTAAKPKKQNWAQKRINELTRERRQAERDRDYWRRVATGEVPKQEPVPQAAAEPNPKDFTDNAAYWRAVARHEAMQVQVQVQEQAKQQQTQKQQQERVEQFLTADEAFAESNPDYRGAAEIQYDPDFPITEGMAEAVFESEIGPQLLHYLDTHRDEAAQIVQMSPARAIAALGRIEERLAVPRQTTAPKKPVTQAPPPPPSAKPKAKVSKDPSDMSMTEYVAWRRKQTQ